MLLYSNKLYIEIMKLKNLLKETPEAYYWLGFIAADGNFHARPDGKLATLRFRIKDLKSVQLLKKFLQVDNVIRPYIINDIKMYRLNIGDVKGIELLRQKYSITSNKTITPMEFNLKGNSLISLLIGYIDGDGHIRNKKSYPEIAIKCNYTWLGELLKWHRELSLLTGIQMAAPYRKDNYAIWCIAKAPVVKYLYDKQVNLCLPVMRRKWDRIIIDDLNKRIK